MVRFSVGLCLALVVGIVGGPKAACAAPAAAPAKLKPKMWKFPDEVEPLFPFVPKIAPTKAEKMRLEALAWFMTGQIRERRNDFSGAYDAYLKAVKLDPKAAELYRSIVPLAFALGKNTEAVKFATQAVELDKDDYELARRLGVFLASQRRIPEAVTLLETASRSKRLKKFSADNVTIHRDLALLYGALNKKKMAADSYEVVFAARKNPKKYKLDPRTQARLEQSPITSYERIGQAFLDAGRADRAIEAFQAARKDRKGKPGSLDYNLARVYFQTKKYGKALKQLQRYLDAQLQTKGRAPYELLAEILKAQKKEKALIGRLEALAKKDPYNNTLQYFLAEQYLAADKLTKAEALYKKTMGKSDDPIALRGLAQIYRKQNKAADWLHAMERFVAGAANTDELETQLGTVEKEAKEVATNKKFVDELIDEGRDQSSGKSPKLKFSSAMVLAKLAAEAKNTSATVHFFRYALKQKRAMASTIYGELGGYLLMADDYKQSAKVFREATEDSALRRARPQFLFRLSQAEELAGNTSGALKAIRDAQKSLPGVALLHYQEAWIYYHARNWDKAIPMFEKVVADFAANREIVKRCQFSLSNIYVLKGDKRKGEAILEKVYAEDPEDISVNNDLGYLWADQGKNLKQAEKMIRKAVKSEPDNPAYLDSLGWVLYRVGKYQEGLPHLKRATELPGGGDATIWDHLGDCREKLGQHKQAVECWTKALGKARKARFPDKKLIADIKKKLGITTPEPARAKRP